MTKDEALKLALEAFEEINKLSVGENAICLPAEIDTAMDACRKVLAQPEQEPSELDIWKSRALQAEAVIEKFMAQPEQEPVVWMYQNKSTHEVRFQKHMRSFVDHGAWYEVPLYSEPLANQEKTSGSPKPAKTEALRLADAMEYDLDWCDEAAAELRRMHDLLGKANALCRIRAEEIERLKAQPEQKPVAWVHLESWKTGKFWPDDCFSGLPVDEWQPLYTTPPQPEQSQVEETLRYEIDALETKLAECRAQQPEPVIDKSAAVRIATSLGWEPKRKPLTIVELQKHWQVAKVLDMTDSEISFPDYVLITKDVEALHGIKE